MIDYFIDQIQLFLVDLEAHGKALLERVYGLHELLAALENSRSSMPEDKEEKNSFLDDEEF